MFYNLKRPFPHINKDILLLLLNCKLGQRPERRENNVTPSETEIKLLIKRDLTSLTRELKHAHFNVAV